MVDIKKEGERPCFSIKAKNIPQAFEKAMKLVWNHGVAIKTQYDKPRDPPSKDARVEIHIQNPFAQPRFHRAFADGLGGMAEYIQEVVNGAHDYWVRPIESIMEEIKTGKKVDSKWIYTYHQRLFEFPFRNEKGKIETLNQIELMAQRLAKDPYTRRAEAITWVPWIDALMDDPPCLQRIWGRIFEDENSELYLNIDTEWRSRDLFKAWFENTIALTTLQKRLADRITEIRTEQGCPKPKVIPGPYTDTSNSLHIYGSYFNEIEGNPEEGVKNFFKNLEERPFYSDSMANAASRTYTSEQIRTFFMNDGTGKGLEIMLEREKMTMPQKTQELIKKDLERLKKETYSP